MKPELRHLIEVARESAEDDKTPLSEGLSEAWVGEILMRRAGVTQRRRRARVAWTRTSLVAATLCLLIAGMVRPSVENQHAEATAMAWLMLSPETVEPSEFE